MLFAPAQHAWQGAAAGRAVAPSHRVQGEVAPGLVHHSPARYRQLLREARLQLALLASAPPHLCAGSNLRPQHPFMAGCLCPLLGNLAESRKRPSTHGIQVYKCRERREFGPRGPDSLSINNSTPPGYSTTGFTCLDEPDEANLWSEDEDVLVSSLVAHLG